MTIKYRIDCGRSLSSKTGNIIVNGKLLFWGALMTFEHLRNYNMQPKNKSNAWIYAKKRMNEAKKQFVSKSCSPKTLRMFSFLAFHKEFGIDMLMKLPPEHGWPNQYTCFSSVVGHNDFYNFSVHTRIPYRSTIRHMSPVSGKKNYFFDVFYDYTGKELVLCDPENRNQAIDFEPMKYARDFYKKLIEDFKCLKSVEEPIRLGDTTFLTKKIDENTRIGVELDFFERGNLRGPYCYSDEKSLCINGLLIQFNEDDEAFEKD